MAAHDSNEIESEPDRWPRSRLKPSDEAGPLSRDATIRRTHATERSRFGDAWLAAYRRGDVPCPCCLFCGETRTERRGDLCVACATAFRRRKVKPPSRPGVRAQAVRRKIDMAELRERGFVETRIVRETRSRAAVKRRRADGTLDGAKREPTE